MPKDCQAQDIPIMTTKKELLQNISYHMMKLASTKVDADHNPTVNEEFARPVTLHRRNPLIPPPARTSKTEEVEKTPVDAEEAERLEALREEKEAQKALDQAKIAPVSKEKARQKKAKQDKKLQQKTIRTDAQKEQTNLKFTEAWPYFLEDADGTNVWQSSFIKAHSNTHVAFKIDQSVFRMIPITKWYKFDFKPAGYKTYTTEEAEALMGKKMDMGRWAMKKQGSKDRIAALDFTRTAFGGASAKNMIKTESDTFRTANKADKMDHDELDVSGDEFQDDDEAHTFEKNNIDEDEKESKDRIRREQRGANTFGAGDELELEKELEKELKEEEQEKTWGKSTKKALVKRDRDHQYESSSDEERNPWKDSVGVSPRPRVVETNFPRPMRSHCHLTQRMRSQTMKTRRRKMSQATASPIQRTRTRARPASKAPHLRRASLSTPLRRAKTRQRALGGLVLPRSRSLAATSRPERPRSPRLPLPKGVELGHRWLRASARPRALALVVTERRPRVKCRTSLVLRRKSSSRAAVSWARHLAPELAAPTLSVLVSHVNYSS